MAERQRQTVIPGNPAGKSPRHPTFRPGVNRRPGRPGYLTAEVEEKFMTALRAGNNRSAAARYAGLRPKTVEEWYSRGKGRDPSRPANVEYVHFARLVDENEATAEVFIVGNVVARSRVDTGAAALWLKARGGPEWRDQGPLPLPDGAAPVAQIDARTQQMNVIVLDPDQIPDVVKTVLEQKRAARVDAPIEDEEVVTVEHGPSTTRDAGLREDG